VRSAAYQQCSLLRRLWARLRNRGNTTLVAEPVDEPPRFNLSAGEPPGTVRQPCNNWTVNLSLVPNGTSYLITPGQSSYADC